MIQQLLWIGAGGFLGAISRFLISAWVQRLAGETVWPAGTMAVNILGCLFIGLMIGLIQERDMFSPALRLLIVTGFLGSLTTFSTFDLEVFHLIRDTRYLTALFNVGIQVIGGLLAVAGGIGLIKWLP